MHVIFLAIYPNVGPIVGLLNGLEAGFTSTHKIIRIKNIDLSEILTLLQNMREKKKKGKMRN